MSSEVLFFKIQIWVANWLASLYPSLGILYVQGKAINSIN